MSTVLATGGLLGALDTTPWYFCIAYGLALITIAAGLFWLANSRENSGLSAGCLPVLIGALGIVFGLTGFTALFIGFFGGA